MPIDIVILAASDDHLVHFRACQYTIEHTKDNGAILTMPEECLEKLKPYLEEKGVEWSIRQAFADFEPVPIILPQ
jgi:hypothetical protein